MQAFYIGLSTFNVHEKRDSEKSQNFCVWWGMKVTGIRVSNNIHVEHL